MSIFGAMNVGITGLQAQSSAIGAISDNLANISTIGYKKSGILFQNLLGNETTNTYSPGGATSFYRQINYGQGIITGTSSATDIAIAGTGFFPVRQTALTTGDLLYTRAGSFVPNADGDFINGAGFFLQGWLLEDEALPTALDDDLVAGSTGIPALQTVNVRNFTDEPVPTTTVDLFSNLTASRPNYAGTPAYDATNALANMAGGIVSPTFVKPVTVVNSLGEEHAVNVGFLKTAANTWAVEFYVDDVTDVVGGNAQLANGTLTFNGDGTLASVSAALTSAVSVTWAPVAPSTASGTNDITFNWGTVDTSDGLSQLDAPFTSRAEQNGFPVGSLTSIAITEEGYVVGNYANGNSRRLYQIPLAVFPEQNELQSQSGNVYAQSVLSGEVNFTLSGTGGFGKIFSAALENSNVDVAEETTNLIIAQRSYQMNTRIVDTSDQMAETVTQM